MEIVRVHRAVQKSRGSRNKRLFLLKQLNVRFGIHICDHVVTVLQISAADLSEQSRKILQRGKSKSNQVAQYYVWAPLNLEVCLHVLTDKFNLAVWSLFELADNQMRIVATEVMEEH